MNSQQVGDRLLVRCSPGERVPGCLVDLARNRGWGSGSLVGIGGVKNVILAYYDLGRRQYLPFEVQGIVELLSLVGNLTKLDDNPIWHLHAMVSDRDGNVRGGHLVDMEVAITLECWIDPAQSTVYRRFDSASGLNLIDI